MGGTEGWSRTGRKLVRVVMGGGEGTQVGTASLVSVCLGEGPSRGVRWLGNGFVPFSDIVY